MEGLGGLIARMSVPALAHSCISGEIADRPDTTAPHATRGRILRLQSRLHSLRRCPSLHSQ
jgi:hypothetical protein